MITVIIDFQISIIFGGAMSHIPEPASWVLISCLWKLSIFWHPLYSCIPDIISVQFIFPIFPEYILILFIPNISAGYIHISKMPNISPGYRDTVIYPADIRRIYSRQGCNLILISISSLPVTSESWLTNAQLSSDCSLVNQRFKFSTSDTVKIYFLYWAN